MSALTSATYKYVDLAGGSPTVGIIGTLLIYLIETYYLTLIKYFYLWIIIQCSNTDERIHMYRLLMAVGQCQMITWSASNFFSRIVQPGQYLLISHISLPIWVQLNIKIILFWKNELKPDQSSVKNVKGIYYIINIPCGLKHKINYTS